MRADVRSMELPGAACPEAFTGVVAIPYVQVAYVCVLVFKSFSRGRESRGRDWVL